MGLSVLLQARMGRRAGLPAAHLVPQAALGGHRLHPGANLLPRVAIHPLPEVANLRLPAEAIHPQGGSLVDHRLPLEDHLGGLPHLRPLPRHHHLVVEVR
mgnify:CR=1 FL=1